MVFGYFRQVLYISLLFTNAIAILNEERFLAKSELDTWTFEQMCRWMDFAADEQSAGRRAPLKLLTLALGMHPTPTTLSAERSPSNPNWSISSARRVPS